MSTSQIYRLGALCTLLGGLLVALGELLEPVGGGARAEVSAGLYYPSAVGILIGGLLFLAGWPAAYLVQRRAGGVVALAGWVLVLIAGAMVTFGIALIRLLVAPWLTTLAISDSAVQNGPPALGTYFLVVGIVATIGGLAFAVATARAQVLSRTVAYGFLTLVIVNLVISFLNLSGTAGNLGLVAYMLGVAWVGLALLRVESPAPEGRGEVAAAAH